MNYLTAFFFWLGFLAVAVTFGFIRESLLIPVLGATGGRAFGTLLVGLIIFGLIYLYVGKIKTGDKILFLKLGIFWTTLTIGFECLFGHYVMRISWDLLLADYNVFRGRLWPLVLLVTLFGPVLARKMRNYFHG